MNEGLEGEGGEVESGIWNKCWGFQQQKKMNQPKAQKYFFVLL